MKYFIKFLGRIFFTNTLFKTKVSHLAATNWVILPSPLPITTGEVSMSEILHEAQTGLLTGQELDLP